MQHSPDVPRTDLVRAHRAHYRALEHASRDPSGPPGPTDVVEVLATMPRDTVALTIVTQLLEQVSWLEPPADPYPGDVLALAVDNVVRASARVVADLDFALQTCAADEHDAAMWTIEAMRAATAVLPESGCGLGQAFGPDTSTALLGLAEAAGRAAVCAPARIPQLAAALGHALVLFMSAERLGTSVQRA